MHKHYKQSVDHRTKRYGAYIPSDGCTELASSLENVMGVVVTASVLVCTYVTQMSDSIRRRELFSSRMTQSSEVKNLDFQRALGKMSPGIADAEKESMREEGIIEKFDVFVVLPPSVGSSIVIGRFNLSIEKIFGLVLAIVPGQFFMEAEAVPCLLGVRQRYDRVDCLIWQPQWRTPLQPMLNEE
ncbi:hypothetical protein B0H19DRAFT_1071400 [Mycena capillaripes]|nr:hypothetical protein B0H19DRAFT_1071400 [Mycena capillaripes]